MHAIAAVAVDQITIGILIAADFIPESAAVQQHAMSAIVGDLVAIDGIERRAAAVVRAGAIQPHSVDAVALDHVAAHDVALSAVRTGCNYGDTFLRVADDDTAGIDADVIARRQAIGIFAHAHVVAAV